MNLQLRPDIEARIREKVDSGKYDSAEQIIEHAMDALEAREEFEADNIERLRAEVQIGIEQADRGLCEPWDFGALKKRLHEEHRQRHGAST